MNNKIRLYGFNNLTKTLSFNIYDVCYTKTEDEKISYIKHINEQYNTKRLIEILKKTTEVIGANLLSVSKQDYEPSGASVNVLISEDIVEENILTPLNNLQKDSVMGHLDKSHLTVHTYPESHPENNISTFRLDIDVSTCGTISPLNALNYLLECFDADIVTLDYRIRGFTRDINGNKYFIDHNISSIQDYISFDNLKKYNAVDTNILNTNIFNTKMMKKNMNIENYVFNKNIEEIDQQQKESMIKYLKKEVTEIFKGC